MKVTFLADELTDTQIDIDIVDFEILPEIGDYISIIDFMKEEQKELFLKYVESIDKISLATVDGRVWNIVNGENNVQLSLYFEPLTN
ncbi:hypothetical protein [Chryseobacterium sp. Marseille-Q3244]|uniref:hypothetical protein n=1 Tax=Chryseobacterium sp. Marseille-Q3244 TaxID=2758092 RepID=UPI002024DFB1|nr:hypothetical protein [Chryseobacterium sp. Marseille-Q3244]